MKNRLLKNVLLGSLVSTAVLFNVTVVNAGAENSNKGGNGGTPLPVQDSMVTTIVDKSVISGSLAFDEQTGELVYDKRGYARFQYTGKVYAIETDDNTGELNKMSDEPIGDITGEAAFPKDFVALSAGVNALMDSMMAGTWDGTMPQMPSVVPWTCNHCLMNVAGSTYVSIVDVLDPTSDFYNADMAAKLDQGLMDGSIGALASMGMDGRAFTGLTPASFDPATKTISVRMAGCSALVGISGPHAGKVGSICINSTATFNVSGTKPIFEMTEEGPKLVGYEPDSRITANGTSNCVTVLHTPTM